MERMEMDGQMGVMLHTLLPITTPIEPLVII